MENASKALLIAGEILIAILIIGVLVYSYQSMKRLPDSKETELKIEQIARFNQDYLSYAKEKGKKIRGSELITLIGKANEHNASQDINSDKIDIQVATEEIYGYCTTTNSFGQEVAPKASVNTERIAKDTYSLLVSDDAKNIYKVLNFDRIKPTSLTNASGNIITTYPKFYAFKQEYFEFVKEEYNSDGKINKMVFRQSNITT